MSVPTVIVVSMTDQFPSRHADGSPRTNGHTAGALVTPAWVDLADNQPGAAARAQALARKDAAPIRAMLARLLRINTEERAWRLGAVGEVKVAAKLSRLGTEWRVLHAIPMGNRGADIDHLVIGQAGVFTLNAKHHPGAKLWVADDTFLVNGQRHPYIRNARYEAERASRLLTNACGFPVRATGIVVPVAADKLVIRREPVGVRVVSRRCIHRYLRPRPRVLDQATVEAIYAAARRSDTWQRPKQPVSGPATNGYSPRAR